MEVQSGLSSVELQKMQRVTPRLQNIRAGRVIRREIPSPLDSGRGQV
jgi:hypothetical protein